MAIALLGSPARLHAEPGEVAEVAERDSRSRSDAYRAPLDLNDRRARDVFVSFEMSPRATPAAMDDIYTEAIPARLEPGPPGFLYVVIEGHYVARHLFAGEEAVEDSFGDFVWTFESATGDVVDARVEGEIVQSVDWGFGSSATRARIEVRMSTREAAGFREGQHVFGNQVFRHCNPTQAGWAACHAVPAVRYNKERGYVNAVGVIEVDTLVGISATSFSPLGEAIFLERALPAVSAGDAVASAGSSATRTAPIE